jgi:ankyrin repeat protein
MGIDANDHSSPLAERSGDVGNKPHMTVRCKDVSSQDKEGNTALHWAAALGNHELVGFLLEAGSGVDAQNRFGWAALHFAAEGVNREVALPTS